MANEDDRAARTATAALAEALSEPLAAGSLEAVLHAARSFHMRSPGDGRAQRVVEALELLMSQVWLGGNEEDERYAEAAAWLESTDLAAARQQYSAILREDPDAERARRLALRVDVVRCAMAEAPLPLEDEAEELEVDFDFADQTRNAEDGELPLSAFDADELTMNVDPLVPPEAFPDEPTRQLETGEYHLLEELKAGAPKETTRVAQPGELPIEKLREEARQEQSDAELDLLLDEIESEAPPALTRQEAPRFDPDLGVEDEIAAEPDPAATEAARPGAMRPRRQTPSRSFPRPREEELSRPSVRSFAKPAEEPILSPPPPSEPPPAPRSAPPDDPVAEPSGSVRHPPFASSSPPPPPPSIPRVDELAAEHQLVEDEETEDRHASWSIREPGADAPPERADVLESWAGVRVYETEPATFEPGVEGVDADLWEDPTHVGALTPEQEAEAAVLRGDLGEALRIYQDLAAQSPNDQRLWDRVAEIARLLQERGP